MIGCFPATEDDAFMLAYTYNAKCIMQKKRIEKLKCHRHSGWVTVSLRFSSIIITNK